MKILCALSHYAYGNPERGENYDYANFLPALRGLGHEIDFFDTGNRAPTRDFADLNAALLARVMEFRPDVMFCVLMHYEVWSDTLDLIRSKSPVLIVNWGTDDLMEIPSGIAVLRRTCGSPCDDGFRGGGPCTHSRPPERFSVAMGRIGGNHR